MGILFYLWQKERTGTEPQRDAPRLRVSNDTSVPPPSRLDAFAMEPRRRRTQKIEFQPHEDRSVRLRRMRFAAVTRSACACQIALLTRRRVAAERPQHRRIRRGARPAARRPEGGAKLRPIRFRIAEDVLEGPGRRGHGAPQRGGRAGERAG